MQLGIRNGHLTENVIRSAFNYCRILMLPFNELAYHEVESTYRSRLHDNIAFYLDIDRELVEAAFDKAKSGYRHFDDIAKVLDRFCDELKRYAELSEKERHPSILSIDELKNIHIDGIPSMTNSESEATDGSK